MPHESRIDPRYAGFRGIHWACVGRSAARHARSPVVLDLVYIGLTLVVFAALWLLVKGVERFER